MYIRWMSGEDRRPDNGGQSRFDRAEDPLPTPRHEGAKLGKLAALDHGGEDLEISSVDADDCNGLSPEILDDFRACHFRRRISRIKRRVVYRDQREGEGAHRDGSPRALSPHLEAQKRTHSGGDDDGEQARETCEPAP